MGAKFRVRLVREVAGRTLLTGQVLDGNLIAGLATPPLKIPGGPQCELTVEAVELGSDPSDAASPVGIRFAHSPAPRISRCFFHQGPSSPSRLPPARRATDVELSSSSPRTPTVAPGTRLRGVPRDRRPVGTPAVVPHVRPCGLL
jgi:hypothetical protein